MMGNKNNCGRKRKRQRQFFTKKPDQSEAIPYTSVRCKKITSSIFNTSEDDIDDQNYNIIVNFKLLKNFVSTFSTCPECCSHNVIFSDDLSCRMGYSHKLKVTCQDCPYNLETFTSDTCKKSEPIQGRNKFDINIRTVAAFREVGKGREGLVNVARCMNMFSLNRSAYIAINEELQEAYEKAANISMREAAVNTTSCSELTQHGVRTCRVSLDGSWQKRGHQSLNGIVSAVSSSKCVDVHVMSKHCKQCVIWENRRELPDYNYDQWKEYHIESGKCEINHEKSSGAMEAAGAVEIFRRSKIKNDLVYKQYLGDGDSSSFN